MIRSYKSGERENVQFRKKEQFIKITTTTTLIIITINLNEGRACEKILGGQEGFWAMGAVILRKAGT